MKRYNLGILVIVAVISLIGGGVVGFFLGIASTEAGKKFLEDLVEEEQKAEVAHPQKIVRERFQLQYPSNWKIDVTDEDYDPDHMFTIESPGAAFIMIVIQDIETDPEINIQGQISSFSKLMGTPAIERFETYGQYKGKGAILRSKLLGLKVTVKAFSFCVEGTTSIIVQQCPDEDLKYVNDGLSLIEKSFMITSNDKQNVSNDPDTGDGL